jgi:hypothetical protein
MKLKRFNKETVAGVFRGDEVATIYIQNAGNMCFNAASAARIGITDHSKEYFVEMVQDEENPKDWYCKLTTPELGFKLRKEKNTNKYQFNSGVISRGILAVLPKNPPPLGTSPLTATLRIGAEPVDFEGELLFPIITSSYKTKTK